MILRNEIPGNNNLLKVTDTYNKVWLIVALKGTPDYKNKSNFNVFSLIMNSGIFGTQAHL